MSMLGNKQKRVKEIYIDMAAKHFFGSYDNFINTQPLSGCVFYIARIPRDPTDHITAFLTNWTCSLWSLSRLDSFDLLIS